MRLAVLVLALTLPALAAAADGPVYHDARLGFTIAYPAGWSVDPHFTRDMSPPIRGVSFTVPSSLTKGTNLGSDTRLSVEHVAGPCSAGRFLDSPQDVHDVTQDGRTYSVATANDAGAGNRYEETVYALANGKTCFGVHYFIHYSAIENFDPGTVKAFDRDGLVSAFDAMRRSLAFTN
jgi:hypothetical protein